MVKKVFDLGTDKNPQIIDWLALTGRGKPEAKSARKKLDDENDDDDMEGPDAPPSSSDLPKAGGRTKDIYGGIISKWTNICQADANYAAEDGDDGSFISDGSDEYDAADDDLIDDSELVERFERRVTSKHEIDKQGTSYRFKIEENDEGEGDYDDMDVGEDDEEDDDEDDFEQDAAQPGVAGAAVKRKRRVKRAIERGGTMDPTQVPGIIEEIEKFRELYGTSGAPTKVLPRRVEEPLMKIYKLAIDNSVMLLKREGGDVQGMFDILGGITSKTAKSLLDKARKLSSFQQHTDKEMAGLEYLAAVVSHVRDSNGQKVFESGPEFVSFIEEVFEATRNKGTPGQFKDNLVSVLKKIFSLLKCLRAGHETLTKIVLTTAGDIFAKTVGGGGETAWLLMEDEVVKEEDKKQANEPLLRKYVASYGKFFLPAGGLAVRPWAPRGYKVAKSKPDVIDLEADAPRHAHPSGDLSTHRLPSTSSSVSALPHLTGSAPPYKGQVFDTIPDAPLPTFRVQEASS